MLGRQISLPGTVLEEINHLPSRSGEGAQVRGWREEGIQLMTQG